MYNISQKDSVGDTLQIYNDSYNFLFRGDFGTLVQGTSAKWLKKFTELPGELIVPTYRLLLPTRKTDFKDFCGTILLAQNVPILLETTSISTLRDIIIEIGTKNTYHTALRYVSDNSGDLFQKEFLFPLDEFVQHLNNISANSSKQDVKRMLERLNRKYPGTLTSHANGYKFNNWDFLYNQVKDALERKIKSLIEVTELKPSLFLKKNREDFRKEAQHNKGIVCVDLIWFDDATINDIHKEPNKYRDEIKELLISELDIDDELSRDLVIHFCNSQVESDTFEDLYSNNEKDLFTFQGKVHWTNQRERKNNHDFVRVKVTSTDETAQPTLNTIDAHMYVKPYHLDELKHYDSAFNITAIRNKKRYKDRERYHLEILQLTEPVEKEIEIDNCAIEKYQKLIDESGEDVALDTFIDNFSSLSNREFMVKGILLAAVSTFGKNHTRTKPKLASNCLIIGDPGQGKSETYRDFANKLGEEHLNFADCTGTSENFVHRWHKCKQTGIEQIIRGPFARVKGKITFVDELQLLTSKSLTDTLSLTTTGSINVSKGRKDVWWDIERPWIGFCNPSGNGKDALARSKFDLTNPKLSDQFPELLIDNVLDRIDQVICVTREDLPQAKQEEIIQSVFLNNKKIVRHISLSNHELHSIFWHARNLDVIHDKETKKKWVHELKKNGFTNARKTQAITRIAESFARFALCNVVKYEHYTKALVHLRACYNTWVYQGPSLWIDRGDQ